MFQKATKKSAKARIALMGPPGSGKTYTALMVGKFLGARVALIDTERKSASKYAKDVADFDVCELPTFSPREYVEKLHGAAAGGYDVVIIDSLSHAWEGEGGILDQVDKRGKGFESWKDMAPQTRDLITAILEYPGHVIVTLRTKTEYVVEERENKSGRMVKTPRKIGLAPKFKEGLEYEFDIVASMDDAVLTVTKSRCSVLHSEVISKPGKGFADAIRVWLEDGVDPSPKAREEAPRETVREAPRLEAPRQKRLTECADREELGEWCKTQKNVSADLRPRLRLGIVKHCADLGISAEETTIFLDAAGFEMAPPAPHEEREEAAQ
jgi:nucleoside-triphosphatase THEP1